MIDFEEGLNNKSSVNYMRIVVYIYMYVYCMCIVNLLYKRIYVNNKLKVLNLLFKVNN